VSTGASRAALLLIGALIAALVALVLVVTGVISVTSGGEGESTASRGTLTPMEVFEQSAAGVVEVRATFAATETGEGGSGLGSGFLVSREGDIITNAHVVTSDGQDASAIVVVFRTGSGTSPASAQVSAELIGSDENSDVALLRIDPEEAPSLDPLPLGESVSLREGEPVTAIGNPLGLSFTVTSGIVSATGRNLRSPNGTVIPNAIQTDAAINSGNSGGPLIDSAGEVIGVNTQIMSQSGGSQGLGFAVPIETAVRVMDQLKATGEVSYAYLGATGHGLTAEMAHVLDIEVDHGLLVVEVTPGSPAADADIRGGTHQVLLQGQPFVVGGDVITAVDGHAIASSEDLAAQIIQREPGETVTVDLVRGTQRLSVEATLAARGS
jgi:S1-C subfamily serine protease